MTLGIPNVFTIAASAPFAETLVAGLIARIGTSSLALASTTIYLPTRRAARSFGDIFARVLGGSALLPNFRALGDVEEDASLLDGADDAFDLPPAIAPLRRRLLLATLIRRWRKAEHGETVDFSQATALAESLAQLLDEVETQQADLAELDDHVPGALAEHWSKVGEFLSFLRLQWPKVLEAEGRMNPAARRNAAIERLAERLAQDPPQGPVLAAGSTGSIPATARLLCAIAHLREGAVVVPGLDRTLDNDSWARLAEDPGHPQFGLRQLLARIGIAREAVRDWTETSRSNPARDILLAETLRPAPTTDAWRRVAESGTGAIAKGLDGLALMKAADPVEESSAIALALRHALETKGRTAALITNDRALARRVTSELGRWDITIDDSAGRPLSHSAPGAFLALLADAIDEDLAPVPLLALLKHPLAMMGRESREFRDHARTLDLLLRGPRPDPGIEGIRRKLKRTGSSDSFFVWFDAIATALDPFQKLMRQHEVPLIELVTAHVRAAERLATDTNGRCALWRSDAGEAASALIRDFLESAEGVPPIEPASYTALFRESAGRIAVRPRYSRHPRLAILGPLEARLQHFDLVILGGLNEGSWPRAAQVDPWLSRPMREAIGLDAPERAIGLSAHDFASLASAENVILSRALKAEGTPTIASRWLQRLTQFARGLKLEEKLNASNDYLLWAQTCREPDAHRPIVRPAPTPPVDARPRKLSVTEIETWLRDPYAIYARRILDLNVLEELDAPIGPLDRGRAIHRVLELFLAKFPHELPSGCEDDLVEIADSVFADLAVPQAVLALWRPRFARASDRFVKEERIRRTAIAHSLAEVKGALTLGAPRGDFILHGRADRIDVLRGGGGLILDYKTGSPPTDKQVRVLLTPQLALEAAMLERGAFPDMPAMIPKGLVYVRFAGGPKSVEFKTVNVDAHDIAEEAYRKLSDRVAAFDNEATSYLSRVKPYRTDIPGDYDHLARVREWLFGEAEEDEE